MYRQFYTKLILICIILFSIFSIVNSTEIDSCQILSTSGTYVLNQSINYTSNGKCFEIKTDNIIIDLNGYTLRSNGYGEAFVIDDSSEGSSIINVVIQNGTISNFSSGITYGYITFATYSGLNATISNINIVNNTAYDIYLDGTGYIINKFNIINSNFNSPLYFDSITTLNWSNNTINKCGFDLVNITTLYGSFILGSDINYTSNGNCFNIKEDNMRFDLNGHTIRSNGNGNAFLIDDTLELGSIINTVIKNGTIHNFSSAISYTTQYSLSTANISNINFTSNTAYDIYVDGISYGKPMTTLNISNSNFYSPLYLRTLTTLNWLNNTINKCGLDLVNITTLSGTFTLGSNISYTSNSNCFEIKEDNMRFNLNGYTLRSNGNGYAFVIDDVTEGSSIINLVIQNGTIHNFSTAISYTPQYASSSANISNINFSLNTVNDIYIDGVSYAKPMTTLNIVNSNFSGILNTFKGITTLNISNSEFYSILDFNTITTLNWSNNTINKCGFDLINVTTIYGTFILDSDITYTSNYMCFNIKEDNMRFDLNGHTIRSNGNGNAFLIDDTLELGSIINILIQNGTLSNFSSAISYTPQYSSSTANFSNLILSSNTAYDIYVDGISNGKPMTTLNISNSNFYSPLYLKTLTTLNWLNNTINKCGLDLVNVTTINGNFVFGSDINSTVGGGICFTISEDNVRFDLNGHTLKGSAGYGFVIDDVTEGSSILNLLITNGTISNFSYGISYGAGVAVYYSGLNGTISNINILNSTYHDIYLDGTGYTVTLNKLNIYNSNFYSPIAMNKITTLNWSDNTINSCGLDVYTIGTLYGTFTLGSNITRISSPCFYIREDNTRFDLNGYSILGIDGAGTYGFQIDDSLELGAITGASVKNGVIRDFAYGIYYVGTYASTNVFFENLDFISNINYDAYIGGGSTFGTFTFNFSNFSGRVDINDINTLYFHGNYMQSKNNITTTLTTERWNTSIYSYGLGNYWADFVCATPSNNYTLSYGQYDYVICNSTDYTLTSGGIDYAPIILMTDRGRISSCRDLNESITYTLTSNVTSSSTCFNVTALDVILNCNSYTITGDNINSIFGIYSKDKNNLRVYNCNITNFTNAVYLENINVFSFERNNLYLNSIGMNLTSSGGMGLVYNNLFNNTQNVVFTSTIYDILWSGTYARSSNIYGGIYFGGNYYGTPSSTGFSNTCQDLNSNGICDTTYNLYGSSSSNRDNYPLTSYGPILINLSFTPENISTNSLFNISGYVTYGNLSVYNSKLLNIYLNGSLLSDSEKNINFLYLLSLTNTQARTHATGEKGINFSSNLSSGTIYSHTNNSVNTTKIIINEDGWYRVSYTVAWDSDVASKNTIKNYIKKNGNTNLSLSSSYVNLVHSTYGYYKNNAASFLTYLYKGDYLELYSIGFSAGTGNAKLIQNNSFFLVENLYEDAIFVIDSQGNQNLNTTTPTYINFTMQEKIDSNSFSHNTTVNNTRVYVNSTGWYRASYMVTINSSGATSYVIFQTGLRQNGLTFLNNTVAKSYFRENTAGTADNDSIFLKSYIYLTAGDYVELYGYKYSGTATTMGINTTINSTWLLLEKTKEAALLIRGEGEIQEINSTNNTISINFSIQDKTDTQNFTHSVSLNNNLIYINNTGWYRISYQTSWNQTYGGTANSHNNRTTIASWITKNSNTNISESFSYTYTRNAFSTSNKNSNRNSFLVYLTNGDYIELNAKILAYQGLWVNVSNLGNETFLLVEKIYYPSNMVSVDSNGFFSFQTTSPAVDGTYPIVVNLSNSILSGSNTSNLILGEIVVAEPEYIYPTPANNTNIGGDSFTIKVQDTQEISSWYNVTINGVTYSMTNTSSTDYEYTLTSQFNTITNITYNVSYAGEGIMQTRTFTYYPDYTDAFLNSYGLFSFLISIISILFLFFNLNFKKKADKKAISEVVAAVTLLLIIVVSGVTLNSWYQDFSDSYATKKLNSQATSNSFEIIGIKNESSIVSIYIRLKQPGYSIIDSVNVNEDSCILSGSNVIFGNSITKIDVECTNVESVNNYIVVYSKNGIFSANKPLIN